jgi:hypothetical protein
MLIIYPTVFLLTACTVVRHSRLRLYQRRLQVLHIMVGQTDRTRTAPGSPAQIRARGAPGSSG